MKMIMLFGGKKQHGKDTLATEVSDYLQSNFGLNSATFSFAEPMKEILIDLGVISREDAYNSDKKNTTVIKRENIREDLRDKVKGEYLDVREALQLFGNDIMKRHFGEDIWIKAMTVKILNSDEKVFLIPDYRFHGLESDQLLKLVQQSDQNTDLQSCYIIRTNMSIDIDDHKSENALSAKQCDRICESRNVEDVMEHACEIGEVIYETLSRMK